MTIEFSDDQWKRAVDDARSDPEVARISDTMNTWITPAVVPQEEQHHETPASTPTPAPEQKP